MTCELSRIRHSYSVSYHTLLLSISRAPAENQRLDFSAIRTSNQPSFPLSGFLSDFAIKPG